MPSGETKWNGLAVVESCWNSASSIQRFTGSMAVIPGRGAAGCDGIVTISLSCWSGRKASTVPLPVYATTSRLPALSKARLTGCCSISRTTSALRCSCDHR